MIRDIQRLGATGRVRRLVAELTLPVQQWRAGIQAAASSQGWQVQTFIVDVVDPSSGRVVSELRAVRTDNGSPPETGRNAGGDAPPSSPPGTADVAARRAHRSGHPCTWD
jgi:hypothetical protein